MLNKTSLHALHHEYDAKMVPFAGYEMPLQYRSGIIQEHQHTREHVGLFDISHMGQIAMLGDDVLRKLEKLTPGKLRDLLPYKQCYTVLTNAAGGIIDDLIVMHADNHIRLIVNAATKDSDLVYLQNRLNGYCDVQMLAAETLLALQGPQAAKVLSKFIPKVSALTFMSTGKFRFENFDCTISRSGYTGEDGFEISLPDEFAEAFAKKLLTETEVKLIGLGARDSLRLEAGLCLYGQDIDATTSPLEAGLKWLISDEIEDEDFPGAAIIRQQLQTGPAKLRVGLRPQTKVPLRAGVELLNIDEEPIGHITSGGYGPTLEAPLAMGYVKTDYATVTTKLHARVRSKVCEVNVVRLPFVRHRYSY